MPQLFSKVLKSFARRNTTVSATRSLNRAVCDTLEGRLHFSVSQNAAGFTVVTPGSLDRVVYVSASQGNDANTGYSSDSPVKTINKAKTIVRQGAGDQMLLKRGDTFNEVIGQWTKSGRSADEPMVIGAYGTGDRPIIATGTASALTLGTASYKTINHLVIQGIYFYANKRDPWNPGFAGGGGGSEALRLISGTNDLLVEDVVSRYFATNITLAGYMAPSSNVRVRRSVFADAYNPNGYAQGLYAENINGLLLEENVIDHNGWNSSVPGAESTIYNHNAYIKENVSNFIARGNVISNAASYGMQARSGGIIENNTFYNNPMQMTYGLVNGGPVTAGGVTGRITNNLFQGGGMTAGLNRGWALSLSNIKSASVTGNVITGAPANSGFAIYLNIVQSVTNVSQAVGVNNVNFENNIINDWTKAFGIADEMVPGGTGYNGLKNITLKNNDFQNIQRYTVLAVGADFTTSQMKLSGNRYHASTGNPSVNLGGPAQEWTRWAPGRETGSSATKVTYPGGYRTLGAYASTIGLGSADTFINSARKQSAANWRGELVGSSPTAYVRSGYGLSDAVIITPTNLQVRPTADSYVRDGVHANTNYGLEAGLRVSRSSTPGTTRSTYLKFNLDDVESIGSATLFLNGISEAGDGMSMQVNAGSNIWSETSINWLNRPAKGSYVGTFSPSISGTTAETYSASITSWLKAQKAAGETEVTLIISSNTPSVAISVFKSNESSMTAKPYLEITP